MADTPASTSDGKPHQGTGLFDSADCEHPQPVAGRTLSGSVPAWLSGSLIRNGPGLFEVGNAVEQQYKHYFDGLALLRKFTIANGQVEFTCQFLRSDAYTSNMAHQRIVVGEFGTRAYPDPCKTWLDRFATTFVPCKQPQLTDNTLVNVFPIGDRVYAATETNLLNRIDPVTLDRLGQADLSRVVPVNMATAHPHFEPDGSVLNLGSAFQAVCGPRYLVVRIPPGGVDQAHVVASIPARWRCHPAYYHSFALTRNYLVFVESPLALSICRLMMNQSSFEDCMRWFSGEGALLHVVSRADGRLVETFKAEDFFTFHHMNAYEDGDSGEILVDLCAYKTGEIMQRLSLKQIRQLSELPTKDLTLRRYHLRLGGSGAATFTEPAGRLAIEFPQINYRYNGEQYRYGYGVGRWFHPHVMEASAAAGNSSIIKLDWFTESVLQWHQADCEPSEAVFVEHPDCASEDHGLLLASVIRAVRGQPRSLFLIVLDAKTMAEVARVGFDHVSIPPGFHGMFFPEELVKKQQQQQQQ